MHVNTDADHFTVETDRVSFTLEAMGILWYWISSMDSVAQEGLLHNLKSIIVSIGALVPPSLTRE
jgi:hypothetical protein